MLLTFSTLGCPDLTLEQVFALAHQHEIRAVELRSLAGTMDLPAYFAKTYGTPENLAAKLKDERVKIAGFATSLRVVGNTPEEREAFRQFVPWAEALGVRWLRAFDGGKTADAVELAQAVDTITWWRELRAKHGWKTDIMIETHDAFVTTPALQRLLAAAPGTALRWDSHHTWKKGGEDPITTWRAIKDHVVFIDVKDSISQPSARHPYTYVLPGTGEFPMAPLRAALQSEFRGFVSLEWEKSWHPYLAPLAEALGAATKNRWW